MRRIEANETILITDTANGRPYFAESPFHGQELPEGWVLDQLNDTTVRALKFNFDTLAAEDITEDCAEAWLRDRDDGCYEIDADSLPPFVANSIAWAVRDLTVKPPLSKHYSTMDARTQGLVRGASF
jgi:hypothetical protein